VGFSTVATAPNTGGLGAIGTDIQSEEADPALPRAELYVSAISAESYCLPLDSAAAETGVEGGRATGADTRPCPLPYASANRTGLARIPL
jgi:hypothetical protein